jgi:signal transduction histidine kinase
VGIENTLQQNVIAIMPELNARSWKGQHEGRAIGDPVPPIFSENSPLPRAILSHDGRLLGSSESPPFQTRWLAHLPPIDGRIHQVDLPGFGPALILSAMIDLRIPPKRPLAQERARIADQPAREGTIAMRRMAERLEERSELYVTTLEQLKPALVLIHPLDMMKRELTNQAWLLGGMWLVACVAVAGVALLLTTRVLKPVHNLTNAIAMLEPGSVNTHMQLPALAAELHPIQERLNELMDRVDTVLRREQQTTANIAHELRTPLTGLRTKLELALSRERKPEEMVELCTQGLSTMKGVGEQKWSWHSLW